MKNEQLNFLNSPLTIRVFRILDYIEFTDIFNIEELAKVNKVSTRTTVSDIVFIKEYLGTSVILEHGKYGYLFRVLDKDIYMKKKQELLNSEFLLDIVSNIFYGDLNTIAEISHQYNVSEGVLRRSLERSRPVLQSYDLDWQTAPLNISGSEGNLRKFFKDFFYEGHQTPFSIMYDLDLQKRGEKRFSSIIGEYEMGSATTFIDFYYTTYIAIQRALIGKKIFVPSFLLDMVYKEYDFKLLLTLNTDINDLYGIELSKEEIAWIWLCIVCKRTNDNEEWEAIFLERLNIGPETEQIFSLFLHENNMNNLIIDKTEIFFKTFFLSRLINSVICPSLNKESQSFIATVRKNYEKLFEKNLNFLSTTIFNSSRYKKDICASLTVHFIMLMDLYQDEKNIYFIIEGEHFINQLVFMQAKELLGNKHNLFFSTFSSLKREHLNYELIDLIIINNFEDSISEYFSEHFNGVPYVLVKHIPDDRDWCHIISMINPYGVSTMDLIYKQK